MNYCKTNHQFGISSYHFLFFIITCLSVSIIAITQPLSQSHSLYLLSNLSSSSSERLLLLSSSKGSYRTKPDAEDEASKGFVETIRSSGLYSEEKEPWESMSLVQDHDRPEPELLFESLKKKKMKKNKRTEEGLLKGFDKSKQHQQKRSVSLDPFSDSIDLKLSSRGLKIHGEEDRYARLWTESHNVHRKIYFAKNLSWDTTLAIKAQQVANICAFEHTKHIPGQIPLGENLFVGESKIEVVLNEWVNGPDEVGSYDPKNPTHSHFTQVVWQATTHVGCATTECDDVYKFKGSSWYRERKRKITLWVCKYSP
ncbi:hypothetical protein CROQUDRAFT_106793 [Cronartium quercuum f. sp. fusiforme G11]|uniref:SCP domain-containing protein n=1 Tax=Cronartium quercuum f. sp. fusiforme G11 TaxID=708437 RepID=A0A9P6NH81_9BASI|nr:hypothetical protein CROQUDRAFT_106793 [Cronartium quercuum f. sp. fusiforme G11]